MNLEILVEEKWAVYVNDDGTIGLREKRGTRVVTLRFPDLKTHLSFLTEVAAAAEWALDAPKPVTALHPPDWWVELAQDLAPRGGAA